VEMLALTPDTPSIAAAAAFLYCLAKMQATQDGRWWLWAGIAAGLGLLAKYSGFFVGAGALFWLLTAPRARLWLATIWPWAGGVLALLIFLPNLWWQTQHQWMTFAFQFGRVSAGHFTLRFLFEFLGAQLGLATPFILALAVWGGWRARAPSDDRFLLLALIAPASIYFLLHALHDRVQGNWPSFLYPMLAILAADAFDRCGDWRRWCSRLAMPIAGLFLLLAYVQAGTGLLPLKRDPLARLLGVGVQDLGRQVVARVQTTAARGVLAGDYETTAWLRFYAPTLPVVAVAQPNRYLDAPVVSLAPGAWLYLADLARGPDAVLLSNFRLVSKQDNLVREKHGSIIAQYAVWKVANPKSSLQGKRP
jgi:4-amino-4-deoxy-L-arabinose transferase-like glycosyltransferase